MTDPILRRATAEDADALTAILRSAYRPYREAGIRLPPVEEGVADDIQHQEVWLAEMEGQAVGLMVLSAGPPAHLMNLAVSPDAAGRGLGARLLHLAETRAAAAGAKVISLSTHADMAATRAWYRAKGWVETDRDGSLVFLVKSL